MPGGPGTLHDSRRPMEPSRCRNTYAVSRHPTPVFRGLKLRGWRWPVTAHADPIASPTAAEAAVAQVAVVGRAVALQQPEWRHQTAVLETGPAPWAPPTGRHGLYDANGRLVLKNLTFPELEAWCAAEGEESPANRALQLWRWMYADPPAGAWVRSLEETRGRQNGFSAKFLSKVGERVSLEGGLQLSLVVRAADGTRKLIFTLTGGEAAGGSVETVLIPITRQQGLRDRLTICVSSQVGCAMNCQFCYTGRMGLLGNLTTAQIVEQVVEARRFLAQEGDRTLLTNLVFMGMGEPLHNTEAVLAASEIISHYLGLHISHNKITISTVGLVPELRSVIARSRVQIALSLHATTDEVRDWIVPVNRRYDLATLVAALEELFPKPDPSNKRQQDQQDQQDQQEQQEQREEHRLRCSQVSTQREGHHVGVESSRLEQQPSLLPEPEPGGGNMAGGSSASAVPPATASAREAGGEVVMKTLIAVSELAGTAGRWLPPLRPTSQQLATTAAGADVYGGQQAGNGTASNCHSSSNDHMGQEGAAGVRGPTASATTRHYSCNSSSSPAGSGSSGGRSLLVEYTMLHGINDTLDDAHRLVDMMSRVNCKINLIVFNPHVGTRFQSSTDEAVTAFRSALVQRGLVCTIRDSRGDDEMAACGQLGNVGLAFRPSPILEAPERFRRFLLPAATGSTTASSKKPAA
ncbi:hypothetical protein VaNZ11_003103 [Volvox africanus]|uniref:Radical SAM core domain-containing protein n=1 Tax=Volvox africanus TaxID=51714 RepID=A0ABQ5RUH9_9CHLO|nr:hypothetical protein VaNZ11_003103 [Volvox africanus]